MQEGLASEGRVAQTILSVEPFLGPPTSSSAAFNITGIRQEDISDPKGQLFSMIWNGFRLAYGHPGEMSAKFVSVQMINNLSL